MAKILKNPTGKKVEIMYDGVVFIFQPGEAKPVEDAVAVHALYDVNCGLVDIESLPSPPVVDNAVKTVDLAKLPMKELYALAKEKGIKAKIGISRLKLIELLLNGQ